MLDTLNDGFFKIRNSKVLGESKTVFTGRIVAAATFSDLIFADSTGESADEFLESGHRSYYIASTAGHSLYGASRGESGMYLSLPLLGLRNHVHVCSRIALEPKQILKLPNVSRMTILQSFNKLILQCDMGVLAYSLDLLAKTISASASSLASAMQLLEASMERVTPKDETVQFFRTGVVADRMLGECASLLLLLASGVRVLSSYF